MGTSTSPSNLEADSSSLIAELRVLLELGGIEGVDFQRVGCFM
jgi:hypothetical protein